MPSTVPDARVDLGAILTDALDLARRRWGALALLLVSLDWGPRVLLGLFSPARYDPAWHDAASFIVFAAQVALLTLCDLFAQATFSVVGLGGSRDPVSASAAMWRVIGRLPALAPWWVAVSIPEAATLWIRWSSDSYAQFDAGYLVREFGASTFYIALSSLIGLFIVVVLAERLSGLMALGRTWRLMARRRSAVFFVALITEAASLLVNLGRTYAQSAVVSAGLGHAGWFVVTYAGSLVWEVQAVVANLIYVALYRELVRVRDGGMAKELAEVFA